MEIIAIVAVDKNLAIGKDGKLPWHYPADLKFFKETTTGNAIVMGYNTYESIGKPLPNRVNIVLSRTKNIENENIKVLRSKEELLEFAHGYDRDTYIIGGAQVFQNFADVIDKWLVTEVPITIEDADTFMPADFLGGFKSSGEKTLDEDLKVKTYQRA
jgi:dihydrofolate reductase